MKNSILVAAFLLISNLMFAQSEADKFEIGVGGTFAKPKIIPGMTKLAIAQITVTYRLTATGRTLGKEKSTGAMAGAKVTASLETSDGDLTPADFQEITNHFYNYFQKTLKANGIDTVAWNAITATEFYKSGEGRSNEKVDRSNNAWMVANAHDGNTLYGGSIGFAFGKIKKAARFSEELNAPAACFYLNLDFAEILVGVDIKTGMGGFQIPKTRTFKYNSEVRAKMRLVQATPGLSLFFNEKSSESLYLKAPIESDFTYHDAITQDPSRMKNNPFRFAKEMVPVVIETSRAKYKEAAKKVLEKYADAFVERTKKSGK